MSTRVPTLCASCARLRLGQTCTSFPDGIPDRIYFLGDDHRATIAGELPWQLDPARSDLYDEWLQYGAPTPGAPGSLRVE